MIKWSDKLDLKNEIPTHILNHLLNNESYCRRVVPFLKKDYFEGPHKVVFNLIVDFVEAHNKLPTSQILNMELRFWIYSICIIIFYLNLFK